MGSSFPTIPLFRCNLLDYERNNNKNKKKPSNPTTLCFFIKTHCFFKPSRLTKLYTNVTHPSQHTTTAALELLKTSAPMSRRRIVLRESDVVRHAHYTPARLKARFRSDTISACFLTPAAKNRSTARLLSDLWADVSITNASSWMW